MKRTLCALGLALLSLTFALSGGPANAAEEADQATLPHEEERAEAPSFSAIVGTERLPMISSLSTCQVNCEDGSQVVCDGPCSATADQDCDTNPTAYCQEDDTGTTKYCPDTCPTCQVEGWPCSSDADCGPNAICFAHHGCFCTG